MASNSKKIILSAVQALQPNEEIRDTVVKGFGVRRRQRTITYFVQRRVNGRMSRVTIGQHGTWTPETARKQAIELLRDMQRGEDPAKERQAARHRGKLLSEVAALFLETHVSKLKPGTQENYQIALEQRILPAMGSKPIQDITHNLVETAHRQWAPHPRAANLALSVIRKLLNWAESNGYRDDVRLICKDIKKYRENHRQRYLSMDEVAQLGAAIRDAEATHQLNPFIAAAFKLLLFTGARRNEILELRWEYVDIQRGVLTLPDSKTGAKDIVLADPAIAVLQALPRIEGNPFVLPGHNRDAHLVNINKAWTRLCKKAGFSNLRLHDLRHSFASAAASLGGSLPTIGRALGHSQPQTTARYAHLADQPVRLLVDKTVSVVKEAFDGPPTDETK